MTLPKFTRAKSLSTDAALKIVRARRDEKDYRISESDTSYIGDPNGKLWPESDANRLASTLSDMQEASRVSGYSISERQEFDRHASKAIHAAIDLTPEIIAYPSFWRWLAVAKLFDVLENRHMARNKPAGLNNFGITGAATSNRLFILWLRADTVYDEENPNPYHLSTRLSSTDFWESGIIRHKYGWAPSLARAFVEFEYPDPDSGKPTLAIGSDNGVRMLYKRLQRLHTIIAFDHMTVEEIIPILKAKSADLNRE